MNPAVSRWNKPGNSLRRARSPVAPTSTITCGCRGPTPGATLAIPSSPSRSCPALDRRSKSHASALAHRSGLPPVACATRRCRSFAREADARPKRCRRHGVMTDFSDQRTAHVSRSAAAVGRRGGDRCAASLASPRHGSCDKPARPCSSATKAASPANNRAATGAGFANRAAMPRKCRSRWTA